MYSKLYKVEIKKAPLRGKGFRTSLFYHKSKNLSIEGEEKMKQLSAKVTSTSNWLTDEQVEAEIARLNASEAVALARREQRLKYRRRQYLYQLRDLEKKGRALLDSGITREVLDALYKSCDEDDGI